MFVWSQIRKKTWNRTSWGFCGGESHGNTPRLNDVKHGCHSLFNTLVHAVRTCLSLINGEPNSAQYVSTIEWVSQNIYISADPSKLQGERAREEMLLLGPWLPRCFGAASRQPQGWLIPRFGARFYGFPVVRNSCWMFWHVWVSGGKHMQMSQKRSAHMSAETYPPTPAICRGSAPEKKWLQALSNTRQ